MPSPFSTATIAAVAARINEKYPLLHEPGVKKLSYGTAGFRTVGALLPPVAARVICVAVLRAWWCQERSKTDRSLGCGTVGFMVTASHNPSRDNGFKIIDVNGGMLATAWEPWCGKAANAVTGEELVAVLQECATEEAVSFSEGTSTPPSTVLIGRDTRATGEAIVAAVEDILGSILHVSFTDYGIATTPQMHFMTYQVNHGGLAPRVELGVPAYCSVIVDAVKELMEVAWGEQPTRNRQQIVVDAANGVGCIGLTQLLQFSQSLGPEKDVLGKYFEFTVLNTNTSCGEALNNACGAEYAHKNRHPSSAMVEWAKSHESKQAVHYYCLDGDADRLIAFSDAGGEWVLIDGDRMSILYAMLLHHWLGSSAERQLDVGIVQTAYANGASTAYVKNVLHMQTFIAATGVKNLHPVAHARDIGVYFEANGHGTVLFRDDVVSKVMSDPQQPVQSAERLQAILSNLKLLLSQVCGDALADMLACEVALRALQITPADWTALYKDLPCLQLAVTVPNPRVITTTPSETQALTPPGLQAEIDVVISAVKDPAARSFVRPSGTEPIVRVYAESTTDTSCAKLAQDVKELVEKYCS